MPIYAYQCPACGHRFDVMQKMTDPAPSACPACAHSEVRKQLSAAGFQLKGKGWYATDFKGGGSDTSRESGGGSDADPKTGCGSGACGGCAAH